MTGKTGIIFDMDGTLWDSSAGVAQAWTEVLKKHPEAGRIVTQEDMRNLMGLTMTQIGEILFPNLPSDKQFSLMKECTDQENEWLREHGGQLYPGLEETLQRLTEVQTGIRSGGSEAVPSASGISQKPDNRTYPLFIESNAQSGYIEAFLDHNGFRKYFQDFMCFGDNGKGKADNIRILAERNHLDTYYYVGDIQADYDATIRAGGKFIHAAYGFGTVKEKVPELKKFRDLPELMQKIEGC